MVKLFIFLLLLLAKPCATFMSCLLVHASLHVCLVSMQTDKIKGPVSFSFLLLEISKVRNYIFWRLLYLYLIDKTSLLMLYLEGSVRVQVDNFVFKELSTHAQVP